MNTNKSAKRIMVYGDSYTFGKIPGEDKRYDNETRFTGVLQNELGDNFEVIEEGLRGRTIDGENKFFQYRNGFHQFGPILASHLPLDLVIIFLGTNSINSGEERLPEKSVKALEQYLDRVQWWVDHLKFSDPQIMIVAPPIINERDSYLQMGDIFKGSESKSRKLVKLLEKFAKSNNLAFFDASKVVQVSKIDGVHLDEENNHLLGEALAKYILAIDL